MNENAPLKVYRVTISNYPKEQHYNPDLWNPACGTYSTKDVAMLKIAEAFHRSRAATPLPFSTVDSGKITHIRPVLWAAPAFAIEEIEVKE